MKVTVNNCEIDLTDEQLIKIDAHVKSLQPKKEAAEQWLTKFLAKDFTAKFSKGYITFYEGEQWVLQLDLKKKYLWCYYYSCWKIFYDEYKMEYADVQSLYKKQMLEPLGLGEFTPDKK